MSQVLSSAQKAIELVRIVQILYQTGEITSGKKNSLASKIKDAKEGKAEFSVLLPEFQMLRFASLRKTQIDEAINIINN